MNRFQLPPQCPEYVVVHWDFWEGIPVRVYLPKRTRTKGSTAITGSNDGKTGAVLFIHGGGFATLNAIAYDGLMYALSKRLRIPLISVEYSLAPECHFPKPVNECESVAIQLMTNKFREFNVDPDKIIIMGDSAGGNMATVVALRLKQRSDIAVQFKVCNCANSQLQVLIYPWIQAVDLLSPSYQLYTLFYDGSALLDPRTLARWMLLYFGVESSRKNVVKITRNEHVNVEMRKNNARLSHERVPKWLRCKTKVADDANYSLMVDKKLSSRLEPFLFSPDFSPIMADDLTNLPTALVITCGYDILRDDGIFYAKTLEEEGVPTFWKHYPGAIHGVINYPSKLRSKILDDINLFISENI